MSFDPLQEKASPPSSALPPPENGTVQGVSRVQVFLDLPEGARVRVTVEVLPASTEEGAAVESHTVFESEPVHSGGPVTVSVPVPSSARPVIIRPGGVATTYDRLRAQLDAWPHSIGTVLFALALSIYFTTRLIGLVEWPIYFFTDEAVQTVLAADLVRDNLRDYDKTFLPTYFKNGNQYNLSTSVYLQLLPYLLFGKSVFITRVTSVLVTLLAAACVGLILRDFFKIPYWWSGTLLLSIAPAWFLHSRTAFETVLFTSLYTAMLYSYLLYRMRSPRYLYSTVGLAALAFYSYSPGQVVVGVTTLLLLLSDANYHWKHREIAGRGLALAALLAIPYLRFRLDHSTAFTDHLKILSSYWVQPLPLREKISHYLSEYLYGLSPGYWFVPNERDLVRHLMRGYGHLLRWTLPFVTTGLVLAMRGIRSPAYRTILIALLSAPTGAAVAQIGVTRALVFVIPATLLAAIGLSRILIWLEHFKLPRQALAIGLFTALAILNIHMLRDALANGPTWYSDYGLGGMQYGARQLFGTIGDILEQSPGTKMIVSPTWSNGTDVVARFFLPDPLPFQMSSIEGHLSQHLPLDNNTIFVITPDEYEKARQSNKFQEIHIEKDLPYPNGKPGFYFVRLRYIDNIDQILAAEREARRELLEAQIQWNGQTVQIRYPHLDMGEVVNAFDGSLDTLLRTLEANPAAFVLDFPQPIEVKGLSLKFGATEANLLVRLYLPGEAQPKEYSAFLQGSVEKPDGSIDFGETLQVNRIYLELKDKRQQEPGHVHLWEVNLE